MKKSNLLKAIAFTLIICILVSYATTVLKLKKVTIDDTANTYIQEGIYNLEKNSIELCLLGNSQVVYGISSMQLLEEFGISAYSPSTSLQSFFLNLFNLKELQKKQNIKTVILDMGSIDRNTVDARNRMVIDNVPLSLSKIQMIWEYCQTDPEAGEFWTYLFPIMKYHSRWNELNSLDFNYKSQNTHVFRGNISSCDIYPIEPSRIICDDDEGINPNSVINELQAKYFEQIVAYCKQNDINLVLIKTPKLDWDKASWLDVQELADKHGLDYLDFNTSALLEATGISTYTDFKDEDHLNSIGVNKLTKYLGNYLLEKYEFTDYRKTEAYKNEPLEEYHKDLRRNLIKLSRDAKNTFDLIAEDNEYHVFIEKTGEISSAWTKDLQKGLKHLGLKQNIAALTNKNFIAHLSGGKSIYEAADTLELKYKVKTPDGTKHTLSSNHITYDEETDNLTNTTYESLTPVGIKITVYDTKYHEIVRTITLYLDTTTNTILMN